MMYDTERKVIDVILAVIIVAIIWSIIRNSRNGPEAAEIAFAGCRERN